MGFNRRKMEDQRRTRWYLVGSDLTYDEWQRGQASISDQPQRADNGQ
jgi:hypothetical protein